MPGTTLAQPTDKRFRTPAYRWVRGSDKLPPIGSDATVAKVKIFDPTGSWTWYIAEFDPETGEAFGLVDGFEKELGYFSLKEMASVKGPLGLPLERDLWFTPKTLEELLDD